MSTTIYESVVLDLPHAEAWATVRDLNLAFVPGVASCKLDGENASWSGVGGVRTVTYKDGTVQKLKLTERSDATTAVAWDLVESTTQHAMGASWSLKLTEVKWPANAVFAEWTAEFSRDASAQVLADAKYKATDFFAAVKEATKTRMVAAGNANTTAVGPPAIKRQLSTRSDLLAQAFKKFDTNGDGKLQFEEFAVVVTKVLGFALPEAALRVLLMEADLDGSGEIEFNEFVEFIGGAPVPTETDSKKAESAAAPAKAK